MTFEEMVEIAEKAKVEMAQAMPTEEEALTRMFQGYQRLIDLGWKEILYCPKDGTVFLAIEPGSTGVHDCLYEGQWPNGHWYGGDDGNLWPMRPCLFKLKEDK